MKYPELVELCAKVIKSYDPITTTVDTHAENFLAQQKIVDEHEATFIKQVLYGCIRYKKLLKVFISSFYFNEGGRLLREDMTMYSIYAYLAIIRMADLTFGEFRKFMVSEEAQKMEVFLEYLFNEANLEKWMRPEWMKLYDVNFVDNELIGPLVAISGEVRALLEYLHQKVAGQRAEAEAQQAADAAKAATKKFTTPEPFNLTRPRPRVIPEPQRIESGGFRAKPVPASTHEPDGRLLRAIEEAKKAVRKEVQEKYANPRYQPPRLRTLERPSNLESVRAEVEARRAAELNFEGRKAQPVPEFPAASVTLNAAAVLREDALYRKKQEAEARAIASYEAELRDASEFHRWQSHMRSKDDEVRAAEIEQRRLEMELANEEAILARLRKVEENKSVVVEMQAERRAIREKLEAELREREEANRAIVAEIQAARDAPREAEREVLERKRRQAEAVAREREEIARKIEETEAREAAARADRVLQLRALLAVPVERGKEFDPTEQPAHGLLDEISYAEMKELLQTRKQRELEETLARREEIIERKQERAEELERRADFIARMRGLAAVDARERRETTRAREREEALRKQAREDEKCVALADKLKARRAERAALEERLREELRATAIKRQFLSADKEKVEENNFLSLEKAAERVVKREQEKARALAFEEERVAEEEEAIRLRNARDAARARRAALDQQARRVEVQRRETEETTRADVLARRELNLRERGVKAEQRATREYTQPYAAEISRQVTATARHASETRRARHASPAASAASGTRSNPSPARLTRARSNGRHRTRSERAAAPLVAPAAARPGSRRLDERDEWDAEPLVPAPFFRTANELELAEEALMAGDRLTETIIDAGRVIYEPPSRPPSDRPAHRPRSRAAPGAVPVHRAQQLVPRPHSAERSRPRLPAPGRPESAPRRPHRARDARAEAAPPRARAEEGMRAVGGGYAAPSAWYEACERDWLAAHDGFRAFLAMRRQRGATTVAQLASALRFFSAHWRKIIEGLRSAQGRGGRPGPAAPAAPGGEALTRGRRGGAGAAAGPPDDAVLADGPDRDARPAPPARPSAADAAQLAAAVDELLRRGRATGPAATAHDAAWRRLLPAWEEPPPPPARGPRHAAFLHARRRAGLEAGLAAATEARARARTLEAAGRVPEAEADRYDAIVRPASPRPARAGGGRADAGGSSRRPTSRAWRPTRRALATSQRGPRRGAGAEEGEYEEAAGRFQDAVVEAALDPLAALAPGEYLDALHFAMSSAAPREGPARRSDCWRRSGAGGRGGGAGGAAGGVPGAACRAPTELEEALRAADAAVRPADPAAPARPEAAAQVAAVAEDLERERERRPPAAEAPATPAAGTPPPPSGEAGGREEETAAAAARIVAAAIVRGAGRRGARGVTGRQLAEEVLGDVVRSRPGSPATPPRAAPRSPGARRSPPAPLVAPPSVDRAAFLAERRSFQARPPRRRPPAGAERDAGAQLFLRLWREPWRRVRPEALAAALPFAPLFWLRPLEAEAEPAGPEGRALREARLRHARARLAAGPGRRRRGGAGVAAEWEGELLCLLEAFLRVDYAPVLAALLRKEPAPARPSPGRRPAPPPPARPRRPCELRGQELGRRKGEWEERAGALERARAVRAEPWRALAARDFVKPLRFLATHAHRSAAEARHNGGPVRGAEKGCIVEYHRGRAAQAEQLARELEREAEQAEAGQGGVLERWGPGGESPALAEARALVAPQIELLRAPRCAF
eukprot:tig00001278_g7996.t1